MVELVADQHTQQVARDLPAARIGGSRISASSATPRFSGGQTFTDRILGVTVRFNSFVQLPGGGSACNVSVAHDRVLLPLAQRSISFAGNFKNGIGGQQVGLAQANGTGSIAPDIAFNTILAATSTVSSAVPLIAPWAGHDNPPVGARAQP